MNHFVFIDDTEISAKNEEDLELVKLTPPLEFSSGIIVRAIITFVKNKMAIVP